MSTKTKIETGAGNSTAAHTPGPWTYRSQRVFGVKPTRPVADILLYGDFGTPQFEESAANARLIAAALELFAALKEMLPALEGKGFSPTEDLGNAVLAAIASRAKPKCSTLLPWLRSNLGKTCLAPLTGTDYRALTAAVHIIDLYAETRDKSIIEAFAIVVLCMQSSTQELAYHAIAHVMDWPDRAEIWNFAGLPTFTPRRCAFES